MRDRLQAIVANVITVRDAHAVGTRFALDFAGGRVLNVVTSQNTVGEREALQAAAVVALGGVVGVIGEVRYVADVGAGAVDL